MHTMLDLETLGTGPNALILSIGAVKFNLKNLTLGEQFHVSVDLDTLRTDAYGFDIDPGTVKWWMAAERQPGRDALAAAPKTDLPSMLEGFALWMGEDNFVWGNGSSFDNVVLRNAYEKLGMEPPWPYWKDRCYRTVKNLAPDLLIQRLGSHHSALDDARSQATHMLALFSKLGLREAF